MQTVELYDELAVKRDEVLQTIVPSDETIYFSGQVIKINKRSVPQKRILIITNKAVYNIHPTDSLVTKFACWVMPCISSQSLLRRRVKTEKVAGVTVSTNPLSDQFVLHVKGEFDYLFDGVGKREKIIKALTQVYNQVHNSSFTLYLENEFNLAQFETKKSDLKAGISKRPNDGHLQISSEIMAMGLNWIIENEDSLLKQPKFYKWLSHHSLSVCESRDSRETQAPSTDEAFHMILPGSLSSQDSFPTLHNLDTVPAAITRRFTSPHYVRKSQIGAHYEPKFGELPQLDETSNELSLPSSKTP